MTHRGIRMFRQRWFAGPLLALLVVGCGGATDVGTPATACRAAFEAAANVDEMADSVSDLYPAVRACGSVAEWTEAFDAVDGAGFTGRAEEILANVCIAPDLAGEPLCAEIQ